MIKDNKGTATTSVCPVKETQYEVIVHYGEKDGEDEDDAAYFNWWHSLRVTDRYINNFRDIVDWDDENARI